MNINKSVPTWLIIAIGLIAGIVFVYRGVTSNGTPDSSGTTTTSTTGQPSLQTQKVDIQNWNVYTSQNDDYQVNYPKEWMEQSSDGNFTVYSKYDSTKRGKVATIEDISFSVRLEKLPNQEGAGIFNKLYDQSNGSSYSSWVKLQNMSVGGTPAIKMQYSPELGSDEVIKLVYLVRRDDKYYYLTFSPFGDESWTKNSAIITNIVESFKFLSKSTISPTPGLER